MFSDLWTAVGWILGATAIVLLGIAGAVVVRRWLPPAYREKLNHPLGHTHGVVGALYAVLVAFMIIALWERSEGALRNFNEERAAFTAVVHYSRLVRDITHPSPQSVEGQSVDLVESTVRQYATDVFYLELPAMKESSCKADAAVDYDLRQVRKALHDVAPLVRTEAVIDHAFRMVDELHLRRDARLSDCGRSMPQRLWVLLIIGAALTMSMTWFYGIESGRLHLMVVAVVSSIIALSFMLAISFQNPLDQVASQGDELLALYWQQTGE